MSENQLREAYTLMKQGDKKNAARLVQDVLREDRNNVQAWWLFANVLEDEEKIVKSLEKVLALNPEHPGARKRLAELRPEYAHLSQSSSDGKEKAKNVDASKHYWDKLHNPPKRPASPNIFGSVISTFGWGLGIRIIFLIALVIIAGIASFFNFMGDLVEGTQPLTERNPILREMENTPESVAAAYIEAYFRQDTEVLYHIICTDYKSYLEEQIEDFEEIDVSISSVDFSRTNFIVEDSSSKHAYVSVSGSTAIRQGGGTFTFTWDEMSFYEDTDFFGVYLESVEETWLVCTDE